ncbi:hypothetical protein J6590_082849 [Homalodisca vitripennis]|nr:hypothetical protein J6590_082849 [Homalodisca vitripennis]
MSDLSSASSPSLSLDSTQASPQSHLQHYLYNQVSTMGDGNKHSGGVNNSRLRTGIIAHAGSFPEDNPTNRGESRKRLRLALLVDLHTWMQGPRISTVGSETIEMQEVESANAVLCDSDVGAVVHV